MKKLFFLLLISLFCFACSDDKYEPDYENNPILGTWISLLDDEESYRVFRFSDDYGFYRSFIVDDIPSDESFQCHYEIKGDQILFKTENYPDQKWEFEIRVGYGIPKRLVIWYDDENFLEMEVMENI